MMILSWALFGLLVGALAKWITPGDHPGGFFFTMLLGIAGGLTGGFLGRLVGFGPGIGFSVASIAMATLGASLLLWVRARVKAA